MSNNTPHDLAVYIYGKLSNLESRPTVDILYNLFQTLFLASLKTEEGDSIKCSVCLINHKKPDPDPPKKIRDPRWTYTRLSSLIEYNVHQLVKLAFATDINCSTIALTSNRKGILSICGLFDQQGGYQSLLKHESRSGWSPPGIIQAQILGVGHIIVTTAGHGIVELNGGKLIEGTIDVFQNKNIIDKISINFEDRINNIQDVLSQKGYTFDTKSNSRQWDEWVTILKRILLRTKGFGHGGAFLITANNPNYLKPKYKLEYNRVPILFDKFRIYNHIKNNLTKDYIHNLKISNTDKKNCKTCLTRTVAENDLDDAFEALSGAVDFISTLSRVDGLVLLDNNFKVSGFGYEITIPENSSLELYRALSSSPLSRGKRKKISIDQFGTRHRSMIRYCYEDPSAVGFVVSSDGPVRAISRIGEAVYMWDNIQLTLKY